MTTAIRPPTDASEVQKTTTGRLDFVDVLRVFLIILVVAHHAGQAYGPTGGSWPVFDPANSELLLPFFAVNAAFFMGLLFFLAGYFVPGAYDRRGAGRFLKRRGTRIGVPLAFFVLFVQGPVVYLSESPGMAFGEYISSLYASGWQNLYIHLWFLGHLLLYSLVYVGWRTMADRRTGPAREWPVPTHLSIFGFVVALAAVTWVVRGWYAIDEWVALLWVVPAELAHFPQYVALFVLGIIAYRGDWLRRMSTATGMVWLGVGLASSVGFSVFVMLADERMNDVIDTGGFNWQSLIYSGWEALICVGLCVGLVVLFRQVFKTSHPALAAMAAASYAAYIVHWLIVVGLQSAIADLRLPALVKFGLVTAGAVVFAFGIGHVSRRVPGLRVVLGTRAQPSAPSEHSIGAPS